MWLRPPIKELTSSARQARTNTQRRLQRSARIPDGTSSNGTTAAYAAAIAPTDAAFVTTFRSVLGDASLTEADVIAFIDGGGVDTALGSGTLADILLFHVINGRRTSTSVLAAPAYRMLNGDKLTRSDLLSAGIAATDISASNGVIHVINSVLLP